MQIYITRFSQLVVLQFYICVGIYKVTSSQEVKGCAIYTNYMARPRCDIRYVKSAIDTIEVVANEEDSFIQREQQIRELCCCITFKHVHVRIYNIYRYIRDLDMQFMRSEIGQKIGKMLCIKEGETV